ncbi:MAG TPA: SpoIIE family protein phosphatase [Solirubrobacteraceae bacterium]
MSSAVVALCLSAILASASYAGHGGHGSPHGQQQESGEDGSPPAASEGGGEGHQHGPSDSPQGQGTSTPAAGSPAAPEQTPAKGHAGKGAAHGESAHGKAAGHSATAGGHAHAHTAQQTASVETSGPVSSTVSTPAPVSSGKETSVSAGPVHVDSREISAAAASASPVAGAGSPAPSAVQGAPASSPSAPQATRSVSAPSPAHAKPTARRRPARSSTTRRQAALAGNGTRTPPRAGAAVFLAAATSAARKPSDAAQRRPASRPRAKANPDPLSVLGREIPLGLPVPDWSRPIILALLIATLALGARAILAARRTRQLEREQGALVSHLEVMQGALVPDVPEQIGRLEISAAYRPAEGPAAGGDFYDAFALTDGRVGIILGDVSGHGHLALKQAALTRYTLRAYLEAGLEPLAALRLAGEVMSEPELEHFATVIAASYDERTGMLTYASAGHPPPLTPRIPGPEVLGGYSSPPLGWGVPTGQRQTVLGLCHGSTVCFFSDGLTEARTQGSLLNRDGLRRLLDELGDQPDATALLTAVRRRASMISDDMAACIIRPAASAPIASAARWEELEIDAPALSSSGPDRFLEACGLAAAQRKAALEHAREALLRSQSIRLRVRVDLGHAPVVETRSEPSALTHLGERRTLGSRASA